MDRNINESRIANDVDDILQNMKRFDLIDYGIFLTMLLGCAGVGLYFGLRKTPRSVTTLQSLESDYLVGGRNMKVWPVALSLIASWISGISLLGIPTDVYLYGTEFILIIGSIFICGVVVHYIFMPVFVDLKLTSTNEYLEQRFDKRMRLFGAVLYAVGTFCYVPFVIYVPAMAFNQVSGVNVHIIAVVGSAVCIFYTTVGGIKAVIWTDVIQTVIMFATLTFIVVKGTMDVGGFSVVWDRNYESNRIEFPELSLDPTIRHSVLSILIGGSFFWIQANAVSQGMFQRYLSLPSIRSARHALWIFIFGVSFIMMLCCYNGLLVFATYHDCDPLTTKLAKVEDQLVPILVMDVFEKLPGVPGVFVAGIFSAALSSLSTALNSLSAVILEDCVKCFTTRPINARQTNLIMRSVVVVSGLISVGLVFVVEWLGSSVWALSVSLNGIASGPSFAIFIMGLMMPFINRRSAFVGGISGLIVMSWVTVNTQQAIALGYFKVEQKPVSTDGCSYNFTKDPISVDTFDQNSEDIHPIFRLSYLYTTFLGTIVTIAVSLVSVLCYGRQNPEDIRPEVLAPFVRRFIQKPMPENESMLMTKENITPDKFL